MVEQGGESQKEPWMNMQPVFTMSVPGGKLCSGGGTVATAESSGGAGRGRVVVVLASPSGHVWRALREARLVQVSQDSTTLKDAPAGSVRKR